MSIYVNWFQWRVIDCKVSYHLVWYHMFSLWWNNCMEKTSKWTSVANSCPDAFCHTIQHSRCIWICYSPEWVISVTKRTILGYYLCFISQTMGPRFQWNIEPWLQSFLHTFDAFSFCWLNSCHHENMMSELWRFEPCIESLLPTFYLC